MTPAPPPAPRAAYVHVPFCAFHCGYCDFAVSTGQDDKIDLYVEALGAELRTLGAPHEVDTLFLGGGTPTHLSAAQFDRLLTVVRTWLPPAAGAEVSVEANPGTLTPDKVGVLADHGVTRVSLGAQSSHPHLLRVLERDHRPEDVARAVELVRPRVAVVSMDLIFGVPGQTPAQWEEDLRRTLALPLDHLSTYGLTFERGTRLWKQLRAGLFDPLAEEDELAMYEAAMDTLEAAGLEHYEISNFAKAGCRCRHNQVYWANDPHLGFGMGAAGYVGGTRRVNTRDLTTYIRKALAGEPTAFQSETLPPEDRARETIGQNLRRREGIDRREFRSRTGFEFDALFGAALDRLVASGHLEDDGTGVRLTRRGKCVADAVIQEAWRRA